MKRVFGVVEVVFDAVYLTTAFIIGITLIFTGTGNTARLTAGVMALVLAGGDAFHLVPRMKVIVSKNEEPLRKALGRGKQITSITMTVFYLFLWQTGLLAFGLKSTEFLGYAVYILAAVRVLLCLLPQNKWLERSPVRWGIWRNIPFFLLGAVVAGLFFLHRHAVYGLGLMWLAIALSFAFYLPVVLWSNQNPKIGMLMLPKTCAYIWMLVMCLSL
ncbi:MAG: hypothetical protein GXZ02_09350 [Clostridiales bacterium]|nr:hypothetical protein [Clostridiales bacterium]